MNPTRPITKTERVRAPWPLRAARRAETYAYVAATLSRVARTQLDPLMRTLMKRRAARHRAKAARVEALVAEFGV